MPVDVGIAEGTTLVTPHPVHMQVLPSHRVIGNYNLTEKEGTVNGPAHSGNLEPLLICIQTELSSAQLIGC